MFGPVIAVDIEFMALAFGVALCGLLIIEYYRFGNFDRQYSIFYTISCYLDSIAHFME